MHMAGYPSMSPFNQFAHPNAGMMNNFLSSMGPYGSSTTMEKELLMLSQMYNSPYASLLASTARGSSSNQYPYGSLPPSAYGSPMLQSMSPGAPSPYTPTTSGIVTNPSKYGSSAFSMASYQQNVMSHLNSYIPNFQKPGSLNNLSTPMAGPSTSRSALPTHQPSALRDIDKDVWSFLTNASSMYSKDDLLSGPIMPFAANTPSNQNVPPGPNAMKNPLLFKELSIPCAEPMPSGTGLNVPSIPTSVITSVGPSKDSPRLPNITQTNLPISSPTPINENQSNKDVQQVATKPPTTTVNATPVTSSNVTTATNKDLTRTQAATTPSRKSPLIATRTTALPSASTNNSPAVISFSSTSANRTSPEPHLIVKNVNAINQSIKPTAPAQVSNKSPTTPQPGPKAPAAQQIKNFNMGIVYPTNKNTPTKFDLNQNDTIIRAAQSQLTALAKSQSISATTAASTSTLVNSSGNSSTSQQPKQRLNVSMAPIPNQSSANKSRVIRLTPSATTTGNRNVRRMANNNAGATSSPSPTVQPTKNNEMSTIRPHAEAAPNVAVSNTTKRWSNQSGLTISPIPNTAVSSVGYKSNTTTNTSKTTTAAAGNAKTNVYTAAAQNLLKNKSYATPKMATVTAAPFRQSPTTGGGGMMRQSTAPSIQSRAPSSTIQTNIIQSTNNGNTIIRQQAQGRPVPPLVRQNTVPSVVSLPGAASIKSAANAETTLTAASNSANTGRPMINRNVTLRRIGTPVGSKVSTTSATTSSNVVRTATGTTPTTSGMMQQRTLTNQAPGMAKVTPVRVGAILNRSNASNSLPVKPATVAMRTTPSTTTQQQTSTTTGGGGGGGGDGVVRRIVVNNSGQSSSSRTVGGVNNTTTTGRAIQQMRGQSLVNASLGLPTVTSTPGGAKV